MAAIAAPDDPLWYKDAVFYELHVRAFYDSDGDGVGDFRGLVEKLDYLQSLGVTALWLLPFYPSPLRDDGYDIADYMGVHPAYGTLRDFKHFLREAHRRGLRVVTELVLNHTSDQHPWFQRARRAPPGSRERDFYVWSNTPDRYKEARIIFKDFEASNWTWDPVAGAYYWHRFYSHQPDLNYDNPAVQKAIFQVVDFWLGMGVDGMRLDAVPYLVEREGTNCENLPETHQFLKRLRRHIDERFPNRMLLAEANQWPEDAVVYFGEGDEAHMAFHFPLMPRMFMAIHMEDRFPIIDILAQTPAIPETCQWALFLRNHDELTLEMVTDEERDYMYRVYASDPQARVNLGIRRRLAPLLGNHRRKIELMNGLLLSLPGTPVIYYGDEIGMGDNIYLGDRNGVRTPMQWSSDRNAGFSKATPQKLYLPVIIDPEYHCQTVNVEAQQNNPHSLLWWMRRLIALRQRFKAFGRGTLELLYPDNPKVLAFVRRYQGERILVVANLSRFVQYAELDLSAYRGMAPVELFGRTRFPPIGDSPYFLTLGPHSFYWFALEPQPVGEVAAVGRGLAGEAGAGPAAGPAAGNGATGADRATAQAADSPGPASPAFAGLAPLPAVKGPPNGNGLSGPEGRAMLEQALPAFLQTRRWFGGKGRQVKGVSVADVIPVPHLPVGAALALARVDYVEGDPELYALPVAVAFGARAEEVARQSPHALICRVEGGPEGDGYLYDALWDRDFCRALLDLIERRRHLKGLHGELAGWPTRALRELKEGLEAPVDVSVPAAEQTHSSVVFGGRLFLKLFRRLAEGVNPDWELGRFLTERVNFPHTPPTAGALEYRQGKNGPGPVTVAILQGFVPNQGDAWQFTLDTLGRFFERILAAHPHQDPPGTLPERLLLDLAGAERPPLVDDLVGTYLEAARVLGLRTARLHLALASAADDPDFAPEPFTPYYQRSLYQSTRSLTRRVMELARRRLRELPEPARAQLEKVLAMEEAILQRFAAILQRKVTAMRIRGHGDYHLGQVLYTGRDFVIIDFEGEPARPLGERRLKRCPVRDVAGMVRSFHYAAYTSLQGQVSSGLVRAEQVGALEPWARFWSTWVSAAFLKAYLEEAGRAPFLPADREELALLLDFYLLEKAIYELGYELNHRPTWVKVPLEGIRQLMEQRP